jgi:hypothetical protein
MEKYITVTRAGDPSVVNFPTARKVLFTRTRTVCGLIFVPKRDRHACRLRVLAINRSGNLPTRSYSPGDKIDDYE